MIHTQIRLVTYKARIGTDNAVAAARAVHTSHRLQSNATWPGITFGHPSALLIQGGADCCVSLCEKGIHGELVYRWKY